MCGSAPSAPQLPQYPGQTPAEQTNLNQQAGVSSQMGNTVQGVAGQLGQNQNILQMISGLFNSDGTINQNALTSLQQQAAQSNQTAGQQGQSALSSLSGLYGQGGSIQNTETAYNSALQGNAPANQQLQFQQQQNFNKMKEQAAQQGITISGDNWSNAVSSSTAGQKLIQNYQQNSNMQNQQYQLGYLGQLGTNLGQLSGVGAQTAQVGTGLSQYSQQNPLSMVQSSITNGQGALTPYLSAYQNQLSQAYQPLYMQQIGPYQQQMAQAQANYQGAMGQYNAGQSQLWGGIGLGTQLLGTGAGLANTYMKTA